MDDRVLFKSDDVWKKTDTVQLSKFILNTTKEGEVWWVAHDCSANQNWLPIYQVIAYIFVCRYLHRRHEQEWYQRCSYSRTRQAGDDVPHVLPARNGRVCPNGPSPMHTVCNSYWSPQSNKNPLLQPPSFADVYPRGRKQAIPFRWDESPQD